PMRRLKRLRQLPGLPIGLVARPDGWGIRPARGHGAKAVTAKMVLSVNIGAG
ncbi:MAG: hypothetical protein QOD93_2493, partial [Acetobacteraceae bacterium]|nr:hypothetical protein [Acetobacteraceae bacterium]